MKNGLNQEELRQFKELGFVGPFQLIESQDVEQITIELKKSVAEKLFWRQLCLKILKVLAPHQNRAVKVNYTSTTSKSFSIKFPTFIWGKARWDKGIHACVPQIYQLSSKSLIIDKVASILGENILQWSAHIIDLKPSKTYIWHGDVEHIEWQGLTVWVALSNVSSESSMRLITKSHNLPNYTYPQELSSNCSLDITQDDTVLQAAREIDPCCELISVDMKPGEFFIFDGRIWHSARNQSSETRTSMIFQYSPPSETIKIPITFYPPIFWKSTPPPCLLIRGEDNYGKNSIVPIPK